MSAKHTTVNISFGTIAKTVFFLLLLYLLYRLRNLALVVLTSVVLASAIEPATRWLIRYRIPRVLAVLLLYVLIFTLFAGTLYFIIPTLQQDVRELADTLPSYIESLPLFTGDALPEGVIPQNLKDTFSLQNALSQFSEEIRDIPRNIIEVASAIFGGVIFFVLIIVISFYLAVQERGIQNFLSIITPVKYEKYVINLWHRSQSKIGLWMRGQLILALIVGILVYLALTIFQVPYALVLAIIAGLFEIIPIFGPILSAVPAVLLAFVEKGLGGAAVVVVIYTVIQQFENQLLYPLVVRQVVGVPPIVAIVAIIAGAQLAGILGVILSIPLAAILMELFNDLDREKHHLREQGAVT